MNKTHNEWAEFIRRLLGFYGVVSLHKYDNFIYTLASQCEDFDNLQTAKHYCSGKVHEFMYTVKGK